MHGNALAGRNHFIGTRCEGTPRLPSCSPTKPNTKEKHLTKRSFKMKNYRLLRSATLWKCACRKKPLHGNTRKFLPEPRTIWELRDPSQHKRSSRMRNMCIWKHNNGRIKKPGRLLGHVCTTRKVNAPRSGGGRKKQINIGSFEGYFHKGRISRARSTSAVGRLCGTVRAPVLLHTRAVESEKWSSWKRKEYEKPRAEAQHSAGSKKMAHFVWKSGGGRVNRPPGKWLRINSGIRLKVSSLGFFWKDVIIFGAAVAGCNLV